ncbi:ABC transporter substrate-binding protein [Erwinia rhapontici]|uniref:ABC transporter substrate-binding protein n=2 Tax=Erwiniaceae TaxID=1903409 RepID=UPI001060DB3A|nr:MULTISPECIES: ABC transporter substrate-binding protein [Erwinia]NKG30546.1 ABC transporter substrate-binding protein [Erwinia rhapontici]NNS05684.1 ABC transporter substrate-binding protein [Erwinia sp. JH02]TDT02564.1 peptide/nickel transport system substrate-binding protein [Erwinia rhapontici]
MTHSFNRRDFIKASLAASVVASGLSLTLTARAAETTVKKGGHLKLGIDGAATTDQLDPASWISAYMMVVGCAWGDTLIRTDAKTGKALPGLAESWEASDKSTRWLFTLRKGVLFHNGQSLTADDVVKTIERHRDAKFRSGVIAYLSAIKSVTAQGDKIEIVLSESNVDFPLVLSLWNLQIQPDGGFDNPNAGIGTGPYRLVKFEPGVYAQLEKNPHDWDAERGHVDSAEVIAINDASARVAALSTGKVHFISSLNPKIVALLQRGPVTLYNTPGRGHYTLPMMVDQAPFSNNDLRLALKYAIDREQILQRVLGGYGSLGNDFPVNAAYPLFPSEIPQRTYDPDKAAFHFKKSGYSGPIVLDTAEGVFPGAVDAATLFQLSAQKAGIKLDIRRQPDDGYWNNVWRSKPFCVSSWGTRLTQDLIYSLELGPTSASNETHFANPQFASLLKLARGEEDEAKRRALYHDIALIVRDEGGTLLPVFNNYLNASSNRLQGYVEDVGNDLSNGHVISRVWLTS